MYGSPILLKISFGYPFPSSSIDISVIPLLLLIETNILLFANLFALPTKFLIPYIISIIFGILNELESWLKLIINSLSEISLKDLIISET